MSSPAGTDLSAEQQNQETADNQLGLADSGVADYLSNVNSQLSAGNPYESKSYLEDQNLATSGAMDSENTAEDQELGSTVAKTGTNSAALAKTEADSARQGQRDLTSYNAARDAANEENWQNEEQSLDRDELAGASEYGTIYNGAQGAATSDLGDYTQAQDAQDEEWFQLGSAAMTGAGIGAGEAFK